MKFSLIAHILSGLAIFIGISMFIPFVIALGYGEADAEAHLLAAVVTLVLAVSVFFVTKHDKPIEVGHRDGMVIVALAWLLMGPVGGLSFYIYAHRPLQLFDETTIVSAYPPQSNTYATHGNCAGINSGGKGSEFCNFTNCIFESTSGFTTTGASILEKGLWKKTTRTSSFELPHGILFWRSLTHFFGGMGIIVLSIAILPLLGVGGMQLFRAEVPGPTADKLFPRIAETARTLWFLYIGLTFSEAMLLWIGGMNLFNAICHSFATMATGGFSTNAASIEGFGNPFLEVTITIFMLLAGMNFSLHFMAVRGYFIGYFKDTETRLYLFIFAMSASIISICLIASDFNQWDAATAINKATFQVASIVTTTGFASADFEIWDKAWPLAMIILFALMFVGGCAGSTGGGPKVVRLWISLKHGMRELYRLVHPRSVSHIHLANKPVQQEVLDGIHGFWVLYLLAFAFVSLYIGLHGHDIITSTSAAIATLGNIGPGFGDVGPSDNYNFLSADIKWLLTLSMVMGRLEVYTLLVLFTPRLWRH